jgi:hypothetical protein
LGVADREEIRAAAIAWRDAEQAYHEQAKKHMVWEFGDADAAVSTDPEPLTSQARDTLRSLRQTADAARLHYQELVAEDDPSN